MFTAKVYRVMVGSLSGSMEEVYLAKETIRKWNQQNAERIGKMFMPFEWVSERDELRKVDVVVGIIDNWLDDPKLLEDCIEIGKRVILFFNAIQDSNNTIRCELDEVKSFRERCLFQCSCIYYNGMTEFVSFLNNRLSVL